MRTLIAWAGDDPAREGLKDTPRRVTDAFEEYYSGYALDPAEVLSRQFEEAGGYDDLVMLRDIRVESHCEHHMAPFLGVAHVAYLPNGRIVGISKIARVVEIFGKRLQTQETMTAQIADAIEAALRPARRGRADRGRAPVHVDARRAPAGRQDHHHALHRRARAGRELPRPLPADGARDPHLTGLQAPDHPAPDHPGDRLMPRSAIVLGDRLLRRLHPDPPEELEAFDKPVAFLHGDTHLFRIDKPLYSKKTNRLFENFTRIETFGWPDTHWVRISVDPADPQLFRFKPEIVPENVVNRRN